MREGFVVVRGVVLVQKTKILMQLQRLVPLSEDALQRFTPSKRAHFRGKMSKQFLYNVRVDVDTISNRDRMAQTIYRKYGQGHYNVLFWSKKGNSYGCSPVKRAEIKVFAKVMPSGMIDPDECTFEWVVHSKPTNSNPSGRVDKMYMFRGWFWRGDDDA